MIPKEGWKVGLYFQTDGKKVWKVTKVSGNLVIFHTIYPHITGERERERGIETCLT